MVQHAWKTARLLLALLSLCASPLHADAQTLISQSIAQVYQSGFTSSMAVQPDGKVIIAGGTFSYVNSVPRNNLARLNPDGSLDLTFNPDIKGVVARVAVDPSSGNIYIGGLFSSVGGVARNHLAKLSSAGVVDPAWNPNPDQLITALKLDGAGNVFVAGPFTTIGGQSRMNLAKISASGTGAADPTWNPNPSGSGGANGFVNNFALDGLGNIYVGGRFDAIGGLPRVSIAKLSTSGTGAADPNWCACMQPGATVNAVVVEPGSGSIFIGGSFSTLGGRNRANIAKLAPSGTLPTFMPDGTVIPGTIVDATWDPGAFFGVNSLFADGSGSLYAAGSFTTIGGVARRFLAKLSTSGSGAVDPAWNPNPSSNMVLVLGASGLNVFVGGFLSTIGGQVRGGLAVLDGSSGAVQTNWPNTYSPGFVTAIAKDPSNRTILGGTFQVMGDFTTVRLGLARLNADGTLDAAWDPRPTTSALFANGASISALASDAAGDVYVGGSFDFVGGQARNNVAKLSGAGSGAADSTWSPNANGSVGAVVLDGSGSVFLGGAFTTIGGQARNRVAKVAASGAGAPDATFDPNANGQVNAIAIDSAGSIFVGGAFTTIGGLGRNRLAKLSLSTGAADPVWNPAADNGVNALALDGAGALYAGGSFVSIGGQSRNRIAKLSASGTGAVDAAWNANANGTVKALVIGPNRMLYVAGLFSTIGGRGRTGVALLPYGAGGAADSVWNANASGAGALAIDAAGNLHVGGSFSSIAGQNRIGYGALAAPGLPGTPSIDAVIAGSTRAIVSFTPPANGGSAITSYVVTCTPGPIIATGSASPITVTGLANGVSYTCSVAAINAAGSGSASAVASVVPGAPPVQKAAISTSLSHTLALDTEGRVYAWGSDNYGQLGQGRAINKASPVLVAGLPAATHIALADHALAVDTSKQVWSWGDNSCGGQLGPREASVTSKAARVIGATNMTRVAAGQCFSLALKTDGAVWAWGLVPGYGSGTNLRQLAGLAGVTQIVAGFNHALALKSDGTVLAFGENANGQLGLGSTGAPQQAVAIPGLTGVTMLAAGHELSLALKSTGEVLYWGKRWDNVQVSAPTALPAPGGTVVAIALGDFVPVVARSDGSVMRFGITSGAWEAVTGLSGITRLAAALTGTFGIDATGQLFATGSNTSGQLGQGSTNAISGVVPVPSFADADAIVASGSSASMLALKRDGTVWFWGADTAGQSGDGAASHSSVPMLVSIPATIKQVAAGDRFSVALDTTGKVWGWGDNRAAAFGIPLVSRSTPALIPLSVSPTVFVQAIAAGGPGTVLYLFSAGDVEISGPLANGMPMTVPQLFGIVGVAAGSGSAYALAGDGKVYAWGSNASGELGNGSTTASTTPVAVSGLSGVTKIAAGGNRAAAVTSDGKVWSWGSGVLGNGTAGGSLVPVAATGVIDAAAVAVGSAATLVLRAAGGLQAWGNTGLADATNRDLLLPYPVDFHEPVTGIAMGGGNTVGFLVGAQGLAWGFGYGNTSPLKAAIGDGAYVARTRPSVLLAAGGAGRIDANNWYLDLDAGTAETIPAASVPASLGVGRLFGSSSGLSLDATVKYRAADEGRKVNNYAFALVPAEFFGLVKNAPGTPSIAELKKLANKDGFILAQLTPAGWTNVTGQLLAYSQGVANAAGGAVNILNGIDASQIPGSRFCIGYGENSGSLLSFAALREVLLLEGASTNTSGVPCVLTGVYVNGPASSTVASSVTFSTSVVGLSPRGVAQFKDGAASLASPVTLTASNEAVASGSITTASLAIGVHSIGASYGGDSNNAATSATIPLRHEVVAAAPGETRTTLSGPSSSDAGSTITFSASVSGAAPTGTVQFKVGGIDLGEAIPLVEGEATLRTSSLGTGSHSITATYSGDGANAASTSNAVAHTVFALIATTVTLTSSASTAAEGAAVTFTATVTGTNPSGTVTFRDGGTVIGSASLVGGVASVTISTLQPGQHAVTADFVPDATSQATNQAVSSGTTVVAVAIPGELTVVRAGTGSGTVTSSPAGINCGASCSASFGTGATVTLTAAPAAGSTFTGWSGGACTGTGTCTVTLGTATTVTATFENPPRLANIATRMAVLTGDNVMIGGFIIGGTSPKTVVVRARGPSLAAAGVPNALANPVLNLYSGQTVIASNDDYAAAANASQLQASGFAPSDPRESAILTTLNPGAYTAIVSGAGGTTGVGIIEVFELDAITVPLINIATRGQVQTGDNVMIGGFIIQGNGPQTVVVRARGPSLTAAGVPGALANPVLQLYSGQTVIAANDDWQTAANAATLQASGFAPSEALESAILITLNPGAYTAIVSGAGGTTGVGIIEVFAR